MHPALHSWREELPATLVRLLAYLGGIAVLSIAVAQFFQSPPVTNAAPVRQPEWTEIERPFPAFALSIPEAAGGRKDILTLGEPDGIAPYLQVEIYRAGSEIHRFASPEAVVAAAAVALGPVARQRAEDPLASKFGALSIVAFETSPIVRPTKSSDRRIPGGEPRWLKGLIRQ